MATSVPVLWITGPSGVGKSAVSWRLFTGLAGSGTRTAFADADQLCICYPAPPDDPGRDLFRARNAGVVIRNCQEAGAWRVVVNGVVDPVLGVRRDLFSYLSRVAEQAAADAKALDHTRLDALRIDTTLRTAGEAADLIAAATGWPGQGLRPRTQRSRPSGW